MEEINVNNILVKLAESKEEKEQMFKLRYEMLILDYNSEKVSECGLDFDEYDKYCDHLIAIDTTTGKVVGTYRLISNQHIKELNSFLSEKEFNIDSLKEKGNILEIGRAVVDEEYRDGTVINLLWKGIVRYTVANKIDYMIGTACFHDMDYDKYKNCFSLLYYNYLIKEDIKAHSPSKPLNALKEDEFDRSKALLEMPSLVKGYLRLGALVGDGVYFDYSFNSIDVLIILKTSDINKRYLKRYLN